MCVNVFSSLLSTVIALIDVERAVYLVLTKDPGDERTKGEAEVDEGKESTNRQELVPRHIQLHLDVVLSVLHVLLDQLPLDDQFVEVPKVGLQKDLRLVVVVVCEEHSLHSLTLPVRRRQHLLVLVANDPGKVEHLEVLFIIEDIKDGLVQGADLGLVVGHFALELPELVLVLGVEGAIAQQGLGVLDDVRAELLEAVLELVADCHQHGFQRQELKLFLLVWV